MQCTPCRGRWKCETWKWGKRFSEQLSITGAPRGTVVCDEFQAVIVYNSCWVAVHIGPAVDDGDDTSDSDDDDATVPDTNSQTESQVDTAPDTPPETDTDNCEVYVLHGASKPSNRAGAVWPPTLLFCLCQPCAWRGTRLSYAMRISLSSWICTEELTVKLN